MEIIKLATYDDGLTQAEALEKAKAKGLRLLTNKEHDELLTGEAQEWKNYKDCYPAWTGTHVEYKAGSTEAKVWDEGEKPEQISLPIQDGWYAPEGKHGLPVGLKSDSSDAKARRLWRWQTDAWSGLVSRGRGWVWGDGRRGVDCYVRVNRLGVLATPMKEHKHKWKTRKTCETCGVEA